MDTKKKMTNRDKMVLFIIGALAVVAIVYFFVFTKTNEKTEALVAANETLFQEVEQLETLEAQKDATIAETQTMQLDIADTLSKFPSEVNTEDAIYDLNQLYNDIANVKIQSESYNMNQVFYQGGSLSSDSSTTSTSTVNNASVAAITSETPVSEVVSAAADYTGYRSDISVAFTAPYNSVKKVVDYINDSDDRMTITSMSMSSSDDTKDLSCSMSLSMYAISGTGEIYNQPDVSNGNTGVDNIFRN
jgi:type IV pilus assembly protein PilO